MTASFDLEWKLTSRDPKDNGTKIRALVAGKTTYVDLYRKIVANNSGDRKNLHVGGLRMCQQPSNYEFEIFPRNGADRAGYARWDGENGGGWATYGYEGDQERLRLLGFASGLPLAVDVVLNGYYAAMGRHDSARTSTGTFRRVDSVNTQWAVA